MNQIDKIEEDQKQRFFKKRMNMYSLLDKPTRKQIKFIGEKLKFMFTHDNYGQLSAEIQVFQLVANSALTLDFVQNQVLKSGQKAARKKISIEKFLGVIKDEHLKLRNKIQIDNEKAQDGMMNKIINTIND